MPIYVVRWPHLTASLVKADDEQHLLDILDEVGDSTGCQWKVYDGPLHIDFKLPADFEDTGTGESNEPIRPEELIVTEVEGLHDYGLTTEQPAGGDTGADMVAAIEKWAFPKVYAVRYGSRERDPLRADDRDLKEAVKAELDLLVKASWQRAHLDNDPDPDAQIARQMGAPKKLVKQWRESFVEPTDLEPTPPKKPRQG